LAKAVLEYRRGKNIVLIIPSICLDNKNLSRWLKPIWTLIIPSIRERFAPHKHKCNKPITVIGFLQPQMIEKIMRKNYEQRNKKLVYHDQLEEKYLEKDKEGALSTKLRMSWLILILKIKKILGDLRFDKLRQKVISLIKKIIIDLINWYRRE
jgi:hypothetical protein